MTYVVKHGPRRPTRETCCSATGFGSCEWASSLTSAPRVADAINYAVHNRRVLFEFAQSARKHRVGRGRVRQVLADPLAEAVLPDEESRPERLVFIGDDATGRALEVMAVRTDRGLLVIHPMDLRPKWRAVYEETKR